MKDATRIVSLTALASCSFVATVCWAQSVTVLHVFSGIDGAAPYGNLVEGSDGVLYGTTTYTTGTGGAASGSGTAFSMTKSGTFTNLHVFTNTSPPVAGLVWGPDGNLYGSTGYDCDSGATLLGQPAATGSGSVFRISPSGEFTTLQSFPALPVGALSLTLDGNFFVPTATTLYKMTPEDGADSVSNGPPGGGTVYQLALDGALTVFDSFQPPFAARLGPCESLEQAPGSAPVGGLTLDPNGNYYGLLYPSLVDSTARLPALL